MSTPAIKDKELVSSSTFNQRMAGKEPTLAAGTSGQYYRGDKTWQTLNKSAVGLSNVDNTSDANKPISTATASALSNKIETSARGAANGVASLGADAKVPAAQLPSYVDDVEEFATKAALPATGESGKIYLVLADESRNNATEQYRWSGSVFTRIPTSPGSTDEVTEGANRLYFTTARVLATVLTGLSMVTGTDVLSTDSILVAIGKLQKKFTDLGLTKSATMGSIDCANQVGGYAGVNFTNVAGVLRDNGTTHSYYRGGAVNSDLWTCDNTGLFLAKNDIGSSSDETLKTNWRKIGPNFIRQLAKVKRGIYDRKDIEATQAGVSAQSILNEVPDFKYVVHKGADGLLTVAYANAALVAAVELAEDAVRKEEIIAQQSELIQKLTERVLALENKST